MNASVIYDVYDKMHMACTRIHPIVTDFVHNKEDSVIYKLPGKSQNITKISADRS